MFLELLTREQQQLFLDVAITIARADERMHLDERAFLRRVSQEVGAPLEQRDPLTHSEALERTARVFQGASGPQKRALLIELAGLVVADGDRSESEVSLLFDLVAAAGVPSSDVPLFLDFAERALELADEARELLAMSNIDTTEHADP